MRGPVLGIESTAHTLGVGIVDEDSNVLANQRDMIQPDEGGIHPREAADHHTHVYQDLVRAALDEAELELGEIVLVGFSQGPGLGPCLRVGATGARVLALRLDVPLVGVNHCVAHVEIGRHVTDCNDPILLYASGGNTQVITYNLGSYTVLGETMDIGIGNMLDKFGRAAGLPFPGGPRLEQLARGVSDPAELVDLPYTVKGMDVAFSGLLTAAMQKLNSTPVELLAHSIQETAFAMMVEVAERALALTGKTEVLLGGGVACNQRLREMSTMMAEARGGDSFAPPAALCVDNGAMIAHTARVMYEAGIRLEIEASGIDQRMRVDSHPAPWRDGIRGGVMSYT